MNERAPDVILKRVAELKPAKRNPRTHSKKQVSQLARSIERFGFTSPILLDDAGHVVAGHGRVAAAKELGLDAVPCILLEGMSEADRRAYVIADNQLALKAGWDMEILALELAELGELDFDISLTGFDLPEVDAILSGAAESSPVHTRPEDDLPAPPADGEAISQLGDRWQLGRHWLVCGDAKDGDVVAQLMGGELADMAFTDPPYNVPISGHVSGMGKQRHREFHEASGEMSRAEFTEFLSAGFQNIARHCKDGAIVYTCMDWRHMREVLEAGHASFEEHKNTCIWAKTNAGMGTFYRSQHEMVFVWKVGTAEHVNNFGLGDTGRYRTNVWSYAGVNTFRKGRAEELALHPTVKPVALVADAIRDVSHRGHIVLDLYGGSGTTLIAAERTGRCARLVEIDPAYCDVIIRRWQALTGKLAKLGDETFDAVEASRAARQPGRGWGVAQ